MGRKTTTVFSLSEESSAGGSSYCRVDRRTKGYYLIGNELGEMAGPCSTPLAALGGSGFLFGMGYVTITSCLPVDEFRQALRHVIMGNVNVMWVNGVRHEQPTVDAVVAAYLPA